MANVTRLTVIKFLGLVLICIVLGLHYNSYVYEKTYSHLLTSGTFLGYLIIQIGLFAGTAMGTPVNRRIDLFYTLLGCILFIVCGIISFTGENNSATIKGVLAIITGVLFLIDAVLTFRGEA